MRLFKRRLRLNLALQGGGAHGAFTWGVLDRLLEEKDFEIGCISATSAGAVNAVAVAAGMAEDGAAGARRKLDAVWQAVFQAGLPDLMRLNPFLYGLSRSTALANMASLMSPYEFNPLGIDPFRRLLEENIDFELIRKKSPVDLLIAATEVATGRAHLFRRRGMTVEAVLASACLPTLHHAVEIDGKAFWDGGFSANPDLVTVAMESAVQDTLIVQINPLVKHGLPTGARDIASQVNRLTFNAPLLRDIEIIETVRETSWTLFGPRKGRLAPLAKHRFHLIEAGRYTSQLGPDTKLKPEWSTLSHLHAAGRTEAQKWLDRSRGAVGRHSSVDLSARFLNAGASSDVPVQVPPQATQPEPAVVEQPKVAVNG